eukprot:scaffold4201_cov178-Amphora_coffeaeformis.AAC.9
MTHAASKGGAGEVLAARSRFQLNSLLTKQETTVDKKHVLVTGVFRKSLWYNMVLVPSHMVHFALGFRWTGM